jgi:Mce-associated membrane protein
MAVDAVAAEVDYEEAEPSPPRRFGTSGGRAVVVALVLAAVCATIAGWFGVRAMDTRREEDRFAGFLATGRQAAIDLTTIDHATVDADVARILDGSAGAFHDEFSQRSKPFVDTVKSAEATSVGKVVEAAVESIDGTSARVLVAVEVTTTTRTGTEPTKGWRMRVTVEDDAEAFKVTDVQFVQ